MRVALGQVAISETTQRGALCHFKTAEFAYCRKGCVAVSVWKQKTEVNSDGQALP